jgi:hypothetical protein
MVPDDVEYTSAEVDSGVVERQAGVVMDEEATVEALKRFLGRWDEVVESEIGFVLQNGVDLIVADIPPVAGDIAHAAKAPCIAISNFTWDWIYEPYAAEYVGRLEQAYSRMDVLLRLPFAQPERLQSFRRIVDAPLIARKSGPLPTQEFSSRKRVLLGSRAQVSEAALARAYKESVDFDFVVPPLGAGFPEAVASSDLVIAKLGFSMAAESIAARKPLLYPPRVSFREEALLQMQVPAHIPALPIPLEDFYNGNWDPYLRQLAAMPAIESRMPTDGAGFCARFIEQYLA